MVEAGKRNFDQLCLDTGFAGQQTGGKRDLWYRNSYLSELVRDQSPPTRNASTPVMQATPCHQITAKLNKSYRTRFSSYSDIVSTHSFETFGCESYCEIPIASSQIVKATINPNCTPGSSKTLVQHEGDNCEYGTYIPQRYWDKLFDLACNAANKGPLE
jgi:hypothetical protein